VPQRFFFQFLLVNTGIALLFAGLFFDTGVAGSQTISTPTPDRLAQPTLPASPSQADKGAQVYWLSCLPCHGDRGQGLTDEFKQTYPVEDRNCWASGCHGKRPYDKGFTLPTVVPAVIGPQTLQKFPNAAVLRAFIFSAMPYWKPGNLTEEESWQVTAFILRENKLWTAQGELTASNADRVLVGPPQATPTPQPVPVLFVAELYMPIILIVGIIILLLLFQRIFRKKAPL
jgi:cytochrome c